MSTQNAFVSGWPKKVIADTKAVGSIAHMKQTLAERFLVTSRAGGWFPRTNKTREKVVTVISKYNVVQMMLASR